MNAINWIVENWGTIALWLAVSHIVALVVVNLTPTPKDDEVVGKVYRGLELLAGLFTSKAKQYPGEVIPNLWTKPKE